MSSRIKKALTRRLTVKGPRGKRHIEVEPSDNVVYLVTFSIYAFMGLTALEVIHVIYFGRWNSEIFAAISGLIGTITGIFVGQKT